MTLRIEGHRLTGPVAGRPVTQRDVEGKDSGAFVGDRPDTIVLHFTAGSSLESAVATLSDPEVQASAHVVIDRDGTTEQLIPFDRVAWHAGKSEWRDRTFLNQYAIGIEMVNAGELKPSGSGFVSWFGRHYEPDEVIEAKHRNQRAPSFWHTFTEAQISACFAVCRAIKAAYRIQYILGHEEIAPGRKTDPGPAFPLDRLRDQILLGRADAPEVDPALVEAQGPVRPATVTAGRLNFRTLPHAGAELAGEPLERGAQVQVVEQKGGWCRIRVTTEGWVHGDYLHLE